MDLNDTMNRISKMFFLGLAVVALAGFGKVGVTKAAAQPGSLIKMNGLSSVYYLGADGKRYVFPNQTTYNSWYKDFSGVVTISQSELESYPLGSNITMRPGTYLVKITTNPKVYAVEPGGLLRAIPDEASAKALYGDNWAKRVVDVPDAFFTNYKMGTTLAAGEIPAGTLVKNPNNPDVYYFDGTNYRKIVDEAAFNANRFRFDFVLTISTAITASGNNITTNEFGNPDSSATGQGTQPGQGTGLTVALSSETPASATIPSNSSHVVFTKFNITASSDGAVVLDTIKVKRSGVGPYNDISGVYLYDGDVRLTNRKTFTSDTNEAEFSALNYTIPAGTTKTFSIVADIDDAGKTGNHALGIASASAITTIGGAVVSGSFPVIGNMMSLSATPAGIATIEPVTTGLTDPTIGDTNVAVASFKIETDEDSYFNSITLKQDGSLATNLLSNFKLYQGSTEVPVSYTINNRRVTLILNTPFKMLSGASKIFTVKADISSNAETGKDIVFFVDTNADLLVTSDAYGFGLATDITKYDTAAKSKTLTLKGGSVTISNGSAPAHDVKTDSTGVELARVTLKSNADTVEIQKMTVQILSTKVTSSYVVGTTTITDSYGTYYDKGSDGKYNGTDILLIRNIKIKDATTGQTLASAKAITDATGWTDANDVDAPLTFTWTDYFTVSKGTTRTLVIVADINSNQTSGVQHTAKFDFTAGNFTVKDSQDNTVTDIVPASVISGNPVTTKTSSLTVSRASSPESRTVVKGSTVDALGMIWSAGSGTGNDVKVSALTLDTYVDADNNGTYALKTEGTVDANELVQQVELYVDGVKIAGPVSVDTNGRAVFDSSDFVGGYYTVPAGTNKTVIVRAIASTNAPYGGNDDRFAFTMDADDITAEDANGSVTATVSGTDVNGTTNPVVGITVTGAGTITVAIDSGRPDAQIIIAGAPIEQELSRIKLTATKENFLVDKLTAQVNEAGSYDDVEYLKLYDSAGAPLSGNVSLDSDGEATFSGLSINVVRGVDTVLVIKGKIAAIGERTVATNGTAGTGADTGDSLTVSIETTAGKFHAIGVSSSAVDDAADAAVGQTMVVRKTKPAVAPASLPVTSLSDATLVLYKFTVTADSNNDVVLKAIQPDMTLNDNSVAGTLDITTSTVFLYDVTSGETQLNTTGVDMDDLIEIDDSKVVTIARGTIRTFEIRGTVTGSAAGDSINTRITKDTAALSDGTGTAANAVLDAQNNFIWSDKSADTNGVGSVEWINSYLLTSWPTSVVWGL